MIPPKQSQAPSNLIPKQWWMQFSNAKRQGAGRRGRPAGEWPTIRDRTSCCYAVLGAFLLYSIVGHDIRY